MAVTDAEVRRWLFQRAKLNLSAKTKRLLSCRIRNAAKAACKRMFLADPKAPKSECPGCKFHEALNMIQNLDRADALEQRRLVAGDGR
jgi:hypothetical protein